MVKNILIGLLLMFFLALSCNANELSVQQKIVNLNNESNKTLGVSLLALAYLVKSSPYSYMPMWSLEESGDINTIRELEKAGLVKVTTSQGLPDGNEPNIEFLNVQAIHNGIEIKNCMMALNKIVNSK